jgi:pimeloyl-ACP methyl ester carboxylesterase
MRGRIYIAKVGVVLAAAAAALSSCVNPAASVEEDVLAFQQKFPGQVTSVERGGKSLRYAWSGISSHRPLLFVHGSPGSWEGWAHFLMESKLQDTFHVISVDRPGYGGTVPNVAEPSLKAQAEFIVAALEANRSGLPAILVGHSFGGPVIAEIAMMYPDKVAGLVFVASSVSPELEVTKWFQYPATWWPIRGFVPNRWRVCNEEIMPLKGELTRILPEWDQISAKTVIVHGEDDPLVPVGNVDFLIKHLKSGAIVHVERVPGLNHFVPWKRPDLILSAIYKLEGVIK